MSKIRRNVHHYFFGNSDAGKAMQDSQVIYKKPNRTFIYSSLNTSKSLITLLGKLKKILSIIFLISSWVTKSMQTTNGTIQRTIRLEKEIRLADNDPKAKKRNNFFKYPIETKRKIIKHI